MKDPFSAKMLLVFVSYVFFIVTIISLIVGTATFILSQFGFLIEVNPLKLTIRISLLCIFLSTILARMLGNRVIKPIATITQATKEIAKGNFDIVIPEDCHVFELNEVAHSFNIMAQELSQIETFRSDFVHNVSHEFKTPISAIEGYAVLLKEDNLTNEERKEYIDRIIYNAKRLSSLSGNILQIAKLENQDIIVEKNQFSLDEQIRQTILLYEDEWTSKNIELDIQLDNVTYLGNQEMLIQVWQNIFGNAVKFLPDGGTIWVKLNQADHFVQVSIKDNGPGMSKQVLKRIFEKFYQEDKSRYAKGNGLGLTLAKRIVDLCDGKITVKSEEGSGTEFIVELPIDS